MVAVAGCGDSSAPPVSTADGDEGGSSGEESVIDSGNARGDGDCADGCAFDIMVGGDVLFGTLLLPDGEGPYPAVLIHAGSGPTDRDGNTPLLRGRSDSLRLLAQGLQARGVASLRFDKRGIGESAGALTSEVGFEIGVLVEDLVAWHTALADEARISRVTLVGHSEGSLIAILAAQQRRPDGLVSLAGVGRPAGDLLREQLAAQLPAELLTQAESFIETLEAGGEIEGEVPPELQSIFRPSVHDYLRSWLAFDPAQELGKVETDALAVVQGTTDSQVTVQDAERLAAAHPDAALHVIDGMSHVLKQASASPADQMAAYTDPDLPVMPEVFDIIVPLSSGR